MAWGDKYFFVVGGGGGGIVDHQCLIFFFSKCYRDQRWRDTDKRKDVQLVYLSTDTNVDILKMYYVDLLLLWLKVCVLPVKRTPYLPNYT
jgi:hypothetical protein